MSMMRKLFAAVLVILAVGAVGAGSASAGPRWLFEGDPFTKDKVETVSGDAVLAVFTLPGGATVVCKKTHYDMGIMNLGAFVGVASVESVGFTTCITPNPCVVKSVTAEKMPWDGELVEAAGAEYLVLENVRISILFGGGEECALDGTLQTIKGTAGALFESPTETFSFSMPSFWATTTKLSLPSGLVEWDAAFTTEATGPHAGEALTTG